MKLPNFLQDQIDKAQDALDVLKPIRHVEAIKARYAAAERALNDLLDLAERLRGLGERLYTDEEVQRVLDCDLDARGSMEHVALAIELGMNYGSLIFFIKMRDFCNGGRWVNTQDRVMVYMARGDENMLAELRERNRRGLEEYNAALAEKAKIA